MPASSTHFCYSLHGFYGTRLQKGGIYYGSGSVLFRFSIEQDNSLNSDSSLGLGLFYIKCTI